MKDLSRNGKHIDLKPEQEAVIKVRVRRQNFLAIHLSYTLSSEGGNFKGFCMCSHCLRVKLGSRLRDPCDS